MSNRPSNPRLRVALYARSASDDESGSQVQSQVLQCREHALRKDWTIVAEYVDASVSGRSSELPSGLQQVLSQAEAGELDALLVADFDRLSRSSARLDAIIGELTKHGVKVMNLDDETPGMMGLTELLRTTYRRELGKARGQGGRARSRKPTGNVG